MTTHRRLAGDGQDGTDTRQVERRLAKDFGGTWTAYGPSEALPVDMYAGFTESPSGRRVLSGVVLLGDAVTAEVLRKVPVTALENSANLTAESDVRADVDNLPPLTRSPGTDPEEFSRLVAEHYRAWARVVPHPAAAMAADAGVKPPTVHTWIREARLRGMLPAGRRRKGGGE